MGWNLITLFFKKIHLSVFDSNFLASQALDSTVKKTAQFFMALLLSSLTISALSRAVKICASAPNLIYGAAGVIKFEDYVLIFPDTLKIVEGTKINELGTLVSGIKIPTPVSYPIAITIGGTDSVVSAKSPFMHIGKTAFSTNVLSFFFEKDPAKVQKASWKEILKTPNMTIDENFYVAHFKKFSSKISIFCTEFFVIGLEMSGAVLQIWISIFIYLIFFGRNLDFYAKFRILMLICTPYFIIMPVSLVAAKGILFTTDISLVCAVIITVRAMLRIDVIREGGGNEVK
jgi:hypothetical protein